MRPVSNSPPRRSRVLNSLTNDVKVTIFYQRKADVYTMIRALLAEYQHANPAHVHVADLDYVKSPGEAAESAGPASSAGRSKRTLWLLRQGQRPAPRSVMTSNCRITISTICCGAGKSAARAFLGELYFTSAMLALSPPARSEGLFPHRPWRAGSGRSHRAERRAGRNGLWETGRHPQRRNALRLDQPGLEPDGFHSGRLQPADHPQRQPAEGPAFFQ